MLNCVNTDVCLPDYFSGDARAWICVPVDSEMSFKKLREMLHSEINQGAIGGNNPLVRDGSGPEGDKWFKEAHAAINRDIRPAKKFGRRPFPFIDAESDDGDCMVYAYFVFI